MEFIKQHNIEVTKKEIELTAANYSIPEILRILLPKTLEEVPSSFETIGHIAHLNLRSEFLPYKELIAKVILEKNPRIRTVVNKLDSIDSTFRTFQMEVIAGENNLFTELVNTHLIH